MHHLAGIAVVAAMLALLQHEWAALILAGAAFILSVLAFHRVDKLDRHVRQTVVEPQRQAIEELGDQQPPGE